MKKKSPEATVVIATHKKTILPSDSLYLPLFVGAELKPEEELPKNYKKDNTGKNISKKNPEFCELTALYWAWKNLDANFIGLCHYRRFFSLKPSSSKKLETRLDSVLKKSELESLLKRNNLILPKKRNYFIENLYDHYIHTMFKEPLEITEKIIEEKFPNYSKEFKRLKTRKSAHMFNMFISSREFLNDYCEWLFEILFELEKRIKKENLKYDVFHSRFYGRVSELLLDVYINTNNLSYEEIPLLSAKPTNWLKKGTSFLVAKFFGKKYTESF